MKKVLLIALFFSSICSYACTSFVIKDSTDLVFGRNLDWISDAGIAVVNKRQVGKTSLVFFPERPIHWVSKYGSLTFNQFGKEFPFGGINEKGLVVELMVVSTDYPSFDDRAAINELQWVQYQLDNCLTIDEVIKTDKFLRISMINQNLHYLICDKLGNSAVIEFSEKGMNVYRDKKLPVPVLENATYANSAKDYIDGESSRFTKVINMIMAYKSTTTASVIDYSFSILNEVALDTSWSIVYDIKNMKIHFRTASYKKIREIDLTTLDFGCESKVLLYDLNAKHQKIFANKYFTKYKKVVNREVLEDAIASNEIILPKDILDQFYEYSEKCKCDSD
jgi:choloylglycine hydrolase